MTRRTPLAVMRLLALTSIVQLTAVRADAADPAESVFRDARGYTVRVRTEITTPFAEDARGAFQGAGFVADARRGWILTNAHVVGQSPAVVHVAFADGLWRPARKLYVDSFTDVAVLAIDPASRALRAARLECSDTPGVGESVGVFGHPLGLIFTGSRGIVSGLTDQAGADLIQIDATVDHGNSGGPVIRLGDGMVVGIATAGAAGQRTDRINFATPMRDVCRILELLARGEAPNPQRMPFALLEDEDGSHTLQVGRTFDRERWPFEPMDRIVRVAGDEKPLETLSDLVTALRGRSGEVAVTVERAGREVQLGVRPERSESIVERRGLMLEGALIAPTSLSDAASLSDVPPFTIQSVQPGSAVEAIGIGEGDMLETVDGERFETMDALAAHLAQRQGSEPLELVLRRWSPSAHNAFDYHVRELAGGKWEWVGREPPVANKTRP